jgi:hypothetical protein
MSFLPPAGVPPQNVNDLPPIPPDLWLFARIESSIRSSSAETAQALALLAGE